MIMVRFIHRLYLYEDVCFIFRSSGALNRALQFGLFFLSLFAMERVGIAATIDLANLLNSGADPVVLDASNTYTLNNQYHLTRTGTIQGNNAAIDAKGPLYVTASGATLTLDNVTLQSSGWGAVAGGSGSTLVIQNGCDISCSNTAIYVDGGTVTVANSTISNCTLGANLLNGSTGVFHATTIINSTRAIQASGGSVTIDQGSSLSHTASSGTAVYFADNGLLIMNATRVSNFQIGVSLAGSSTGELHAVEITGCKFGVQVVGGSVTIESDSILNYDGFGTGLGVIDGASGVVHDSTFTGFGNAIDVQPSTPKGTVEVRNSIFLNNNVSALSVVSAEDVLFSNCHVEGAVADGVYFHQSTGVVENSKVIGSGMTGVTFWGCSNGAIIRNTLIKNSGDQGLGIVVDDLVTPPIPSRNVQVIGNTIVNNKKTNFLIDDDSTARLQGNIFAQTREFTEEVPSIRLHGAKGVSIDSALITNSNSGIEIKDGSSPTILSSTVTQNAKEGILVYDDSALTLENSYFWYNNNWSIFVNEGATVTSQYSSFGPAGVNSVYNNAGTTCEMTDNYWASSKGPSVNGVGEGASLWFNLENSSSVTYSPFLTEEPLDSSVSSTQSLPSGGSLSWDSSLGVTVNLVANTGSTPLESEIAGILRINDTDHLGTVSPPAKLIPGQIYVVWVSTGLRLNSSFGSLMFALPSQTGAVGLQRRDIDGNWSQVASTWDSTARVLTYSPSDVHSLNGTFGVVFSGSGTTLYVCSDGICGDKPNCHTTIESAVSAAQNGSVIRVANDVTYKGDFSVSGKTLTIQGGWDLSFVSPSGTTSLQGSPLVTNGSLTIQQVKVSP